MLFIMGVLWAVVDVQGQWIGGDLVSRGSPSAIRMSSCLCAGFDQDAVIHESVIFTEPTGRPWDKPKDVLRIDGVSYPTIAVPEITPGFAEVEVCPRDNGLSSRRRCSVAWLNQLSVIAG